MTAEAGADVSPFQYWWYTQSVTLPSFEIGEETYQMVNRKFKYPGLLTWNDIQIVLYEIKDEAAKIMRILNQSGYLFDDGKQCGSGILKGQYASSKLIIEELKPSGKTLQSFDLINWYIKGANFGELTYDDDGFVTVTLTIGYDSVKVSKTSSSSGVGDDDES